MLQPVDSPLHQIALPVQGTVERTGASFVDFPRDAIENSLSSEISPNPAAAVPFVAADPLRFDGGTATPGTSPLPLGHQPLEHAGLVPLTRGQHEGHRLALTLDPQMDFGTEPSTDNAFIELFNGRFRQECLNENWLLSLEDAREKEESWRNDYNGKRPHSALGNLSSREFAVLGQIAD